MIHCFDYVFAHRCLEDISYFWSVYIQSVTVSAVASWQKKSILGKKQFIFSSLAVCTFPPQHVLILCALNLKRCKLRFTTSPKFPAGISACVCAHLFVFVCKHHHKNNWWLVHPFHPFVILSKRCPHLWTSMDGRMDGWTRTFSHWLATTVGAVCAATWY